MRTTCIALMLLLFTSMNAKQVYSVVIKNTSDVDQTERLVEIPLQKIKVDKRQLQVMDAKGVEQLSQITSDNTLLFQAKVGAGKCEVYYISDQGKSDQSTVKVYGRYFTERYGDFAWENDRVGFRLYGSPLEKVQAPTNGIDLWLKRTERMVLEDWYANDLSKKASYHIDHGEGCDPYGVGPTLGAGAIAPYINDEILRNTNHTGYRIIDNGPLRIKFEIAYPNLEIEGRSIPDSKIITLDAGSYYTKVEQNYGGNKLDVAVGVVKRTGDSSLYVSEDGKFMVYEEPEMPKDGQVYVGVIFPKGKMVAKQDHYTIGKSDFRHNLATTTASKKGFVYYTGFGWSKSNHPTLNDFVTYTKNFVEALESPLKIKIQKIK